MTRTVAAAATHVGHVRDHNEDSYHVEPTAQLFMVADGMGGHAAGEVASGTAVEKIHTAWMSPLVRDRVAQYQRRGDAETRRELLQALRQAVLEAHLDILEQARRDEAKRGMGTTFTGFLVAGGDALFAHVGDSRAYLVRDGICILLSEDHTLSSRLKAAGVDLKEHAGELARWKGILTNALGVGGEARVATFVLQLSRGDRLVLCSDGVHDYLSEMELGQVVLAQPSAAAAAQRLVEVALERGGADNATAVVVEVVEAGETTIAPEKRQRDQQAVAACPLFANLSDRERLRAMRITTERELRAGRVLEPYALGERVAYIVLEGEASVPRRGEVQPGALVYPEALIEGTAMPARERLATAATKVRLLVIRRDDFLEITREESELGVKMYSVLARVMTE